MKRGWTLLLLGILFLFLLGCLPSFDAQNLILNDPRVKAFLEENPNADITIVHFSTEESVTELPRYAEACGKMLTTGKELYKAEMVDVSKGLKIITYLDARTNIIDCVRKYGEKPQEGFAQPAPSGTPATPPAAIPPATEAASAPSSPTPACGDGRVEGTCTNPAYFTWKECYDNVNSVSWSGEYCDDGNARSGDGCNAACVFECTDSDGGGSGEENIKGTIRGADSYEGRILEKTDECVTGFPNRLKEHYCGGQEKGFILSRALECPLGCSNGACMITLCGNGRVDSGEYCDDGNTVAGDGCTSSCVFECTDSDWGRNENSLGTTWGGDDGGENSREEKTDSCHENGWVIESWCNTISGKIQTGAVTCSSGKVCRNGACAAETTVPACGNSVKEGSEQCDDGNTNSGDGCSSTCQTERRLLY